MSEHFVEEIGVSLAWGRAMQVVARPGRKEMAPLTVAVTGDGTEEVLSEHDGIRGELEEVLAASDKQAVETVANDDLPELALEP